MIEITFTFHESNNYDTSNEIVLPLSYLYAMKKKRLEYKEEQQTDITDNETKE